MRFAQPERLVLLLFVVALAVLVFARRRRVQDAVRFSDRDLLDELRAVAPKPWRRRFVALGMILSSTILVVAAADPQHLSVTDTEVQTVVLSFDVSRSMESVDVPPNRMDAAKEATLKFIDSVPEGVSVGLVSFSSVVKVVVAPTPNRDVLRQGIAALEPETGTAVGESIFTALGLLESRGWVEDPEDPSRSLQLRSGVIVLVSDGATTVGRPDTDAAAAAARAGVPVFAVAFGTPYGTITVPEAGTIPVPASPEAMDMYASTTGGRSFEAFTGEELNEIFDDLGRTASQERAWVSLAPLMSLVALAVLFTTCAVWARSGSRLAPLPRTPPTAH
jgi:Ca-activated chloride channel homolog